MKEEFRTIEVNGIKMEVDMRYARRIDSFRVGDTVKVLDQRNGNNKMIPGVITDFANFKDLPSIIVAVYKAGDYWSEPNIEFITYNSDIEDIEIVGVNAEELLVSRETIIEKFDDEIIKQKDKLNDLIIKRDTFVKYFGHKEEQV